MRTDTVERMDSVYRRDSVWECQRGDTVYKERLVFLDRYKYRYRAKTDTFIRRDTVYLPKPAERSLSKWEQRYVNLGKYAMGAIVSIISVIICLAVWRWHKKKFINENDND